MAGKATKRPTTTTTRIKESFVQARLSRARPLLFAQAVVAGRVSEGLRVR
jgi:hypothetical protein